VALNVFAKSFFLIYRQNWEYGRAIDIMNSTQGITHILMRLTLRRASLKPDDFHGLPSDGSSHP